MRWRSTNVRKSMVRKLRSMAGGPQRRCCGAVRGTALATVIFLSQGSRAGIYNQSDKGGPHGTDRGQRHHYDSERPLGERDDGKTEGYFAGERRHAVCGGGAQRGGGKKRGRKERYAKDG